MLTRRIAGLLVVLIMLAAAFVVGRSTAPSIHRVSIGDGSSPEDFRVVAAALIETDLHLEDQLDRLFLHHDISAVRWRQLVGELRLLTYGDDAAAWFEGRDDVVDDVGRATLVLEEVKLGPLQADDLWDAEAVAAAQLLDDVLRRECGVGFSTVGYIVTTADL